MVVGDAHEYLQQHYKEFDFIWTSPPCPTHSRMNFLNNLDRNASFPDMKLYEEIIFLQSWFKGKYVVENVRSYYKPLIEPQEVQSHYFWANFTIPDTGLARKKVRNDKGQTLSVKMEQTGFYIKDFYNYKGDKRTLLNNLIEPELGKHIFDSAVSDEQSEESSA